MWLGPSPLPLWAWQKLASLIRGRQEGPHRHLGVSWKPHTKAGPLMLISSFFHWRFLSTSLSETLYGSPRLLDNGPCSNPASREEAETKGLTSGLASSPHPLPPTFHRVRGKVGLRLVNWSLPARSPCPPFTAASFVLLPLSGSSPGHLLQVSALDRSSEIGASNAAVLVCQHSFCSVLLVCLFVCLFVFVPYTVMLWAF